MELRTLFRIIQHSYRLKNCVKFFTLFMAITGRAFVLVEILISHQGNWHLTSTTDQNTLCNNICSAGNTSFESKTVFIVSSVIFSHSLSSASLFGFMLVQPVELTSNVMISRMNRPKSLNCITAEFNRKIGQLQHFAIISCGFLSLSFVANEWGRDSLLIIFV